MAHRILIFSMAMGPDYSFELNSIETYAPQFFGHNDLFLGSVSYQYSLINYPWPIFRFKWFIDY